MTARIIGVGQLWAGDDGAGLAVIGELRDFGAQCELVELDEPSRLIDLLTDGADPVVLIDAILGDGPAGRVLQITSRRDPRGEHLLSTHGVGVIDAIELARITHPERVAHRIFIVGIAIEQSARRGKGLSAAVKAAVPRAAAKALELALEKERDPSLRS